MMGRPGGTALVEGIKEALDFRRAMRKVDNKNTARTGGSRSGAQTRSPDDIGRAV